MFKLLKQACSEVWTVLNQPGFWLLSIFSSSIDIWLAYHEFNPIEFIFGLMGVITATLLYFLTKVKK